MAQIPNPKISFIGTKKAGNYLGHRTLDLSAVQAEDVIVDADLKSVRINDTVKSKPGVIFIQCDLRDASLPVGAVVVGCNGQKNKNTPEAIALRATAETAYKIAFAKLKKDKK